MVLQWVFVLFILFSLGVLGIRLVKSKETPPLSAILSVGIGILTILLLWLHFFIPISLFAQVIVITLAIGYIALDRKYIVDYFKNVKRPHWLIIVAGIIFVLFLAKSSLNHMTTYDTWLYHDQSVKWNEQLSIVPGLGNVHSRFAFSSTYFLTNAFFSNEKTYIFSSFLLILLLIVGLENIQRIIKKDITASSIVGAASLIALVQFIKDLPSLSNDVGGGILLIITITTMAIAEEKKSNTLRLIAIFIGLYTITIKLTSVPLGILAIYLLYTFIKEKKYTKIFVFYGAIGFLLYIPFFIRNVIISGYLLYPFKYLDIFNVSWKMPLEIVINEMRWVKSWARIPGMSPEQVLDNGFMNWFNIWMSQPNNNFFVILLSLAVLILVISVFFSKTAREHIRKKYILYVSIFALICFWFTQAPDIRFGYTLLLLAIIFSIMPTLEIILKSISRVQYGTIFLGFIFITIIFLNTLSTATLKPATITVEDANRGMNSLQKNTLIKESPILLNNTYIVHEPLHGDWCLTAPLPCTPFYKNGTAFYMRGKTLQEGFNAFN